MIQDFRDVLLLILGWLLGTLSPGIGRAILRSRRRAELLRGLNYECSELRFTLANALFSTRRSLREIDQPTLDLVKPILLNYAGTEEAKLVAAAQQLFNQPDASVIQWANDERTEKKDPFGRPLGQWPAPYSLPLLSTHIGELDLLPVNQQEAFLRVGAELRLFNEQVDYVRMLHERTFTTSGPNHQLNDSNLIVARRNLGTREDILIRAINRTVPANGCPSRGAAR
jgi:hypothetical protein